MSTENSAVIFYHYGNIELWDIIQVWEILVYKVFESLSLVS